MSSTITTTKTFVTDTGQWQVHAVVEPGGDLPIEIWLYEVDDNGDLGLYASVSDREQLSSRAVWTGEAVNSFGNKYVRNDEMTRTYPDEATADIVIDRIVADATKLSVELSETLTTVVEHTIP